MPIGGAVQPQISVRASRLQTMLEATLQVSITVEVAEPVTRLSFLRPRDDHPGWPAALRELAAVRPTDRWGQQTRMDGSLVWVELLEEE